MNFDPINKRIILDTASVDTKDVYSSWKRWVAQSDNAKYLPAFRVDGGSPLGGGRYVPTYLFLQPGWKIRPMEANHTLHIAGGGISSEDGSDPVTKTIGNYNVLTILHDPNAAIGVDSGGGSSVNVDYDVLADKVVERLLGNTISADVKKVNGITVTGQGTEANPWGPV